MIHLASNSKSRALLLKNAGVKFIQKAPIYDEEQIKTSIAKDFVYIASRGKMVSAIEEFGLETPLLTADSVIATKDGTILRKPKDIDEARRVLELQSGDEIAIISAMHLKSRSFYLSDISATYYKFAPFEPKDLDEYLDSGNWIGKAGGCMVEGFCKKYILDVNGYESTAMGLQVELLLGWMRLCIKQS
jgi:septum formation protein